MNYDQAIFLFFALVSFNRKVLSCLRSFFFYTIILLLPWLTNITINDRVIILIVRSLIIWSLKMYVLKTIRAGWYVVMRPYVNFECVIMNDHYHIITLNMVKSAYFFLLFKNLNISLNGREYTCLKMSIRRCSHQFWICLKINFVYCKHVLLQCKVFFL